MGLRLHIMLVGFQVSGIFFMPGLAEDVIKYLDCNWAEELYLEV